MLPNTDPNRRTVTKLIGLLLAGGLSVSGGTNRGYDTQKLLPDGAGLEYMVEAESVPPEEYELIDEILGDQATAIGNPASQVLTGIISDSYVWGSAVCIWQFTGTLRDTESISTLFERELLGGPLQAEYDVIDEGVQYGDDWAEAYFSIDFRGVTYQYVTRAQRIGPFLAVVMSDGPIVEGVTTKERVRHHISQIETRATGHLKSQ